jgi:(p)ppGpp synthase/HD superfamily hydrolase
MIMVDYKRVVETLRSYFKNKSFDGKRFEESRINVLIAEDVIESLQRDRMRVSWAEDVLNEIKSFFPDCQVEGRIKAIHSIIYKVLNADDLVFKALSLGETIDVEKLLKEYPLDTIGFKIITKGEQQCYQVLNKISKIYSVTYINNRISKPKPSGYRDIRLVAFMEDPSDNSGLPLEIIIQSEEIYRQSKEGQQAHGVVYGWKYDPEMNSLPIEFKEKKL